MAGLHQRHRRRLSQWWQGAAAVFAACLVPVTSAAAHAPHDTVTEVAMSPTFLQDHTLFASFALTDHTLFGRSTNGGLSWQEYGLPMMDEAILDFAFSPRFAMDGIAFAGTSGGGIWRTTDAGLTWTSVSTGLPSLVARSISVSPDFPDDGLVLTATDGGCARSTDGGLTWTKVTPGITETTLRVVEFAPGNSSVAYIGGKTLHMSSNGGLTWAPQATFPNFMETLALSPHFTQNQTLMLAFGRHGYGVRFSTNGGLTFSDCNQDLTDNYVYEIAIADDGTVFAATKTAGCYRASAPGAPWTLTINGFEDPSDLTETHNTEALVSPQFGTDGLAFIGAYEGLYVTHDGGASWRQSNVYNQHLNRHIVFSPDYAHDGEVFFGNYGGGVLQYTASKVESAAAPGSGPGAPAGNLTTGAFTPRHPTGVAGPGAASAQPDGEAFVVTPWQGRSNNIAAIYSDALALSPDFPTDRTMFYAYTVLCRSTDAGVHWTQIPKPAGVTVVRRIATSPDFSNDGTVIFGSAGQGVWRSIDGGDSFSQMQGGLPAALSTSSIDFSPDYVTDRTVFIASRNLGVYRSADSGRTWTPANTGLTNLDVRCFTVSPDFATDATAFAGTVGDGLFVSHDAGRSWTAANAGLPVTNWPVTGRLIIESIVLSPDFATDGTALVATLNDGVFRSVDGCRSWVPASAGLPRDSVRTMEISPDFVNDRRVFAGTYGWTYETTDAGASWSRLPGGLRVDETAVTVYHSNNWSKASGPDNNAGGVRLATGPGPWEELQFFGDRIVWYANTGFLSGIAHVSIDGAAPVSVDLYEPGFHAQVPVFDQRFAEPGWHVIRVTSTGTKNPASKFTRVDSDGYFYAF